LAGCGQAAAAASTDPQTAPAAPRSALARLLLSDAGQAAAKGASGGLLLLDEPTNHLDRCEQG
jgi:ABC-type hemin transport system ATPase subunit